MEVRHLRYFVAVADEQSFTRAADLLHVAQSALSQQIRRLEREFGVVLFSRTSRRVELTAAGRELVTDARRALNAFDATAARSRQLANGEAGSLRLGFVTSAAYGLLPRLLLQHARAHPHVRLELLELTTSEQVNALAAADLDLGIGRDLTAESALEVHTLITEPLVVALPSQHRLAHDPCVACADLRDEPFIVLPRAAVPRLTDVIESICRTAGFALRPSLEARQFTTILGLVAAELGIAIVPESVTSFRPQGLIYRPLQEQATSRIQLIADPERLFPTAQRFLDFALAASLHLARSGSTILRSVPKAPNVE